GLEALFVECQESFARYKDRAQLARAQDKVRNMKSSEFGNLVSVEAHFCLRQITSQQPRYGHLVSSLPPDVAEDLADILASPHPCHPYDTLKTTIISRKSDSEPSRLQQLITAAKLGGRRPSQLLRRMPQLLGGPSASQEEKVLLELFFQHLPQSMVPALGAAGDVPVDTLAEMADGVTDYSRAHSLSAVTKPPPPPLQTMCSRASRTIWTPFSDVSMTLYLRTTDRHPSSSYIVAF
ncbi:hypothetical protein MTO96_044891, partial [Rhipicephalus appendiculatus]